MKLKSKEELEIFWHTLMDSDYHSAISLLQQLQEDTARCCAEICRIDPANDGFHLSDDILSLLQPEKKD